MISEAICTLWFPAVFILWRVFELVPIPCSSFLCNLMLLYRQPLVSKALVNGDANKNANCFTCCLLLKQYTGTVSTFMDDQTNFSIFCFTFLPLTLKPIGFIFHAIKNQVIPSSVMLSAINYDCVIWSSKVNNKALLSLCLPHRFFVFHLGKPLLTRCHWTWVRPQWFILTWVRS